MAINRQLLLEEGELFKIIGRCKKWNPEIHHAEGMFVYYEAQNMHDNSILDDLKTIFTKHRFSIGVAEAYLNKRAKPLDLGEGIVSFIRDDYGRRIYQEAERMYNKCDWEPLTEVLSIKEFGQAVVENYLRVSKTG